MTQCLLDGRSVLVDRLARSLGQDTPLREEVRNTVVYLASLHDIGKVHHGFQERRRGNQGIPREMLGHVLPLLRSLKSVRALHAPFKVIAHRAGGLAAVESIICHHGRPYRPYDTKVDPSDFWLPTAVRDPIAQVGFLDGLALSWSGLAPDTAPRDWEWTPRGLHLLAGIVTLADWIGSSERYFKPAPEAQDDPGAYWHRACAAAERACEDIGIRARAIQVPAGTAVLEHLFPRTFPEHEPTVLQRHLSTIPLPTPGTRLVIESDTGSGKTEAALALFARLRAAGVVDGLFFALPTRATASAMHARVDSLVERLYPRECRPTVELATGGRQGAGRGDPIGGSGAQMPDEGEPAALERWTSRSTRHAMISEVVVGTVDQALLAALATRHAHLRLAGVMRHMLIVDEVHAYDRYMTAALRVLTTVHAETGGVVLFMSATLASEARAQLVDGTEMEVPSWEEAIARDYPSLSSLTPDSRMWREEWMPARDARTKSVSWAMASLESALEEAIAAARAGARVAILRNTVRDARETLDVLAAAGAEPLIWRPPAADRGVAYHSRYTLADRAELDARVLADFGRGTEMSGRILVTTQVAEQSLDLDFDILVSDLCPIDVLLQRLGRVHRHPRSRPSGYGAPQAIVIEPSVALAEVVSRPVPFSTRGHGTVYPDLGDLELTRRLIAETGHATLPEKCRLLVESVYHPERRAALSLESRAWEAHLQRRDGEEMGQATHAEICVIRFDKAYTDPLNVQRFGNLSDAGGRAEAAVRTRLGDDRVRITLPHPVRNRIAQHGGQDTFVDLDTRILARSGMDPGTPDPIVPEDWTDGVDALSFTVGRLRLSYDDRGWHWTVR